MTPRKLAFVSLVSFVGLAAASTSARAQPGLAPVDGPWRGHDGATFEANVGVGAFYANGNGDTETDFSPGAVAIGIGGFVTPQLALTLRLASLTYATDDGEGGTLRATSMVIGPHVQFWLSPQLWLGGGAGLATSQFLFGNEADGVTGSGSYGVGVDVRVGFTVWQRWRQSINVSVEATPAHYGAGTGAWANGLSANLGFQFL